MVAPTGTVTCAPSMVNVAVVFLSLDSVCAMPNISINRYSSRYLYESCCSCARARHFSSWAKGGQFAQRIGPRRRRAGGGCQAASKEPLLYCHHRHAVASQAPVGLDLGGGVAEAELDLAIVPLGGALPAMHLFLAGTGGGVQPRNVFVLVVDPQIGQQVIEDI